jgi:hypothetical protein
MGASLDRHHRVVVDVDAVASRATTGDLMGEVGSRQAGVLSELPHLPPHRRGTGRPR